jgi:hypothetical protein
MLYAANDRRDVEVWGVFDVAAPGHLMYLALSQAEAQGWALANREPGTAADDVVAEVVKDERAVKLARLSDQYVAWRKARIGFSVKDGEADGPSSNDWQYSDDEAFEMLGALAELVGLPEPETLESCICGECFDCPDGWHSDKDMPCSCTADCALAADHDEGAPHDDCDCHDCNGREATPEPAE